MWCFSAVMCRTWYFFTDEWSLIVLDFTISVCGKLCNQVFGIRLSSFLSDFLYFLTSLDTGTGVIRVNAFGMPIYINIKIKQRSKNCWTQKWLNSGTSRLYRCWVFGCVKTWPIVRLRLRYFSFSITKTATMSDTQFASWGGYFSPRET